MKIIKVSSLSQLKVIEQMAEAIIPDHYSSFLPMEHIRYFINTYQTVSAMEQQLLHGFEYSLMNNEGENVAYLGIEKKEALMILSKIYVLNEYRGKGIGNLLMNHAYKRAVDLNLPEIDLYVVKENDRAISFYKKEGFHISETLEKEYENGYIVTEYKMSKTITL